MYKRQSLLAAIVGVHAFQGTAWTVAGKVRTLDEVYGWDQTLSQGLLVDVEHATLGRVQLPGPPLRFFAPSTDGETETTRRDHLAPPTLGADGDAIRAWLAAGPAS